MSAHGGLDSQGHPGCGLGAERGPVWEGQAESGQRRRGCRPRGKRMGALGPWTRRKVGARKSGSDLGFSRIPPAALQMRTGRRGAGGSSTEMR